MLRELRFIFFLILLVFPLGQIFRLPIPFLPAVKLQALDLLVFWFVAVSFLKRLKSKKKPALPPLLSGMAFFVGWAGLSLLFKAPGLPILETTTAFLYFLRLFLYFAFTWSFYDFIKEKDLPVFKYLLYEGVAVAALSLLQYFFIPDMRFLFSWGWDDHLFRAVGLFFDPAFTGLLLVFAFILWLSRSLEKKNHNFFWWLSGFLMLAAVGLSFSRIAYLLVSAGSVLVFAIEKKKRQFWLILIPLLLAAVVFSSPKPAGEGVNLWRLNSFWAKAANYQAVWRIIKDNLFLGVGFNAYRFAQRNYGFLSEGNWEISNAGAGADNSFLFVWATTGLVGLSLYLYWWEEVIRRAFISLKTNKAALVLLATGLSAAAAAFFFNALFYPWVLFWLGAVLAKFMAES